MCLVRVKNSQYSQSCLIVNTLYLTPSSFPRHCVASCSKPFHVPFHIPFHITGCVWVAVVPNHWEPNPKVRLWAKPCLISDPTGMLGFGCLMVVDQGTGSVWVTVLNTVHTCESTWFPFQNSRAPSRLDLGKPSPSCKRRIKDTYWK